MDDGGEIDRIVAAVKVHLDRLLDEAESPGRRRMLMQVLALVLDQAGVLPRPGIARVLGKSRPWIDYAIIATRRRTHHAPFARYVAHVTAAITAAIESEPASDPQRPPPGPQEMAPRVLTIIRADGLGDLGARPLNIEPQKVASRCERKGRVGAVEPFGSSPAISAGPVTQALIDRRNRPK